MKMILISEEKLQLNTRYIVRDKEEPNPRRFRNLYTCKILAIESPFAILKSGDLWGKHIVALAEMEFYEPSNEFLATLRSQKQLKKSPRKRAFLRLNEFS